MFKGNQGHPRSQGPFLFLFIWRAEKKKTTLGFGGGGGKGGGGGGQRWCSRAIEKSQESHQNWIIK